MGNDKMGCGPSTSTSNVHKQQRHCVPSSLQVLRCQKILKCGHQCCGGASKTMVTQRKCAGECFGCTVVGCPDNIVDDDAACPICLEAISSETPSLRLDCSHAVHAECLQEMLCTVEWHGKMIQPAQIRCPAGCGAFIQHPVLSKAVDPLVKLAEGALKTATAQAAEDEADVATPALVEAKYSVYQCATCSQPFCGGLKECNVEGGEAEEKAAVCQSCQVKGGATCRIHGSEFMVGKCNYCCEPATFNCGGGRYLFCTPCHVEAAVAFHEGWFSEWERSKIPTIPKCDPTTCPFGGNHPGAPGKATYGWQSLCTECHRLEGHKGHTEEPQVVQAKSTVISVAKCATPGCNYAAHPEPAPWNGRGRYCCSGCMEHAAKVTLAASSMKSVPSEQCHEARCRRENPGQVTLINATCECCSSGPSGPSSGPYHQAANNTAMASAAQ